ncbi:hypothetical protein [Amycolatopsis sp. NPDC051371]|uniref:hypothetical protein n=1 Tax=Amycolatopsis sp. NPDC051371 TaxID=3155800 RepID=UPI003440BF25
METAKGFEVVTAQLSIEHRDVRPMLGGYADRLVPVVGVRDHVDVRFRSEDLAQSCPDFRRLVPRSGRVPMSPNGRPAWLGGTHANAV